MLQISKRKVMLLFNILFGGKTLAWCVFFAQRRFLSVTARKILVRMLWFYNRLLGRQMSSESALNDARVSELKTSGLLFLPELLNNSQINEIVDYLVTKLVYPPYINTYVSY